MNRSPQPAARQPEPPMRQVPCSIEQGFQVAVELHQQGRLAEAEAIYRKILAIEPRHANALHQLGLLAYQVGQGEIAVEFYRKAIAADPGQAAYFTNLGLALQTLGRLEECAESYASALALNPAQAEAHLNLGLVQQALGRLDDAIASIQQAILLKPHFPEAHYNLGNLLQSQDRLDESIRIYRRAIEQKPELAQAYCNLGNVFSTQNKPAEAKIHYEKALAVKPDYAEALYNLGNLLQAQDELADAALHYERALALDPRMAEAHSNLGKTLQMQERLEEALVALARALVLKPLEADACYDLGCVLKDLGQTEAASASFARALAIEPDHSKARFAQALTQLMAGDFANGWRNYEGRWLSPDHGTPKRGYPLPLWEGAKLDAGKVLLWGEQGIGDEIQFAGLIPDALGTGNRITVECDARLRPLFERSFPDVEVTPRLKGSLEHQLEVEGEIAAHLPTGSLAALFRSSEAAFAATVSPYLKADAGKIDPFRARYGSGGRRVGIAWQTNNAQSGKRRSINLGLFAPLFAHPGLQWISLQYGDFAALEQQVELANAPVMIDRTVDQMEDVDLFAAQIAAMDLVITIDNSTAHLAGALGVPVHLLLPFSADWRWMLEREDSPWYPSMQIYRQTRPGDWIPVLEKLKGIL